MKHLTEEERAKIKLNSMDTALEQFFNNVLECIVIDENYLKS